MEKFLRAERRKRHEAGAVDGAVRGEWLVACGSVRWLWRLGSATEREKRTDEIIAPLRTLSPPTRPFPRAVSRICGGLLSCGQGQEERERKGTA